jgi:DNA polymerase II large subunit
MLRNELQRAYAAAAEARKAGIDPTDEVEVKVAKDIAARVEGIVGPPGVAEAIRVLEGSGMAREDIAFEVAKRIASGELMKGGKEQLIEQAVRTGLGILTEGVLVAPTEGIAKVKIKTNPDGSDYVAVYYAGPIRSAGGTAAAMSLLLADFARRICGIGDYRATDSQVSRIYEEIVVYETRCVHLQYLPSEDDIRIISGSIPVCVDGEPTEEVEVSAYRDVPGIETNRVRSGVALVICDGVALKASKLFKYTKKLRLGWDWLEKIIKIKKKEDRVEIKADSTYLEGLVAGRPVFSHPSSKGGFRLRYGRSKTNGLMAKNVHPAVMILLENFLAYGTHMKIERPGKGCVVSAHERIEPPVVRLKGGRVLKVRSVEEAYALKDDVDEILFLGDLLCTYGDFAKSNHPLLPSGYCEEWWERELEAKGLSRPAGTDARTLFEFSRTHGVPLHPAYTYHWHDISPEQLGILARWLAKGSLDADDRRIRSFAVPLGEEKGILENLLVEHRVAGDRIVLEPEDAFALLSSLGLFAGEKISPEHFERSFDHTKGALELVNSLSGIKIRAKSPTYIGARMGRPEKAKERKMDGSPHVLFPTGSFKNRSISKQYRTFKGREGEKAINLEVVRMRCTKCRRLCFYRRCDICLQPTVPERICQKCGRAVSTEMHCDLKTISFDRRPVDIVEVFESAKARTGASPEDVKGVKGLSNPLRIPERLEKGFLRAKHDVYVFRDGTCRFDATDVPLTHFTPAEVGLGVGKARELGYEKDHLGAPLESAEQTLPLKHQDIVLSENGADYFIRVAGFIDDMLVNVYGMKPFYNVRKREDLVGHLLVGLSPHTSAGVLCRIIGFTKANVGYGHPYFHTAKRRNADGDEDCVMLLMDALINFSRHFLDEKRGGTMDAPLVLSIDINPKEVDDEAHSIEIVSRYPLEFYEAAERNASPAEVKIKTVKDVLGTSEQFDLPLTHLGGTLDVGNIRTAYVELQSIPEKIDIQFRLQGKLRPVDKRDAAERLILSHFIPDLYGNLRSFSRQTFRCVSCNTIFRRVPLSGKCGRCGGGLLLTINKGGIEKYLDISRDICERYDLPLYLRQRLELVEKEIKSIFEDDKIKQMGLSDFL